MDDYMYGEVIGFVEVTQRPYGMGEEGIMVERPVLTNLSVCVAARQSGVGSALVTACERVAYSEYCSGGGGGVNHRRRSINNNINDAVTDGYTKNNIITVVPEIILEVEDDNWNAIQFYRKRGYVDVCIDPTSRRYDTTGLWLQQVRCKRLVMRKDLRRSMMMSTSNNNNNNNIVIVNMENTVNMGIQAFQRFRKNLMNAQ
jgi:ribosomal protein S18 acetylase RimI-like enzyme